jgi:hypothetical protein
MIAPAPAQIARRDAAVKTHRASERDARGHWRSPVRSIGSEEVRVDLVAAARGADKHHVGKVSELSCKVRCIVSEAHRQPTLHAEVCHLFQQVAVGGQCRVGFVPGNPKIIYPRDDCGHGRIDECGQH